MKYSILILFFFSLLLPNACQKTDIGHSDDCTYTPTPTHPNATKYQTVLDAFVAKGLPGISALVRDKNGVWVGASGKADISENIDMKPCTVSKACSITKTFIGTLALKLVEEGRFGLDDPLTKWLGSTTSITPAPAPFGCC